MATAPLEQASWWLLSEAPQTGSASAAFTLLMSGFPPISTQLISAIKDSKYIGLRNMLPEGLAKAFKCAKAGKDSRRKKKTFSINALHGMGVGLCYLCCCGSPFSPQVSPTTTGLHVNYLSLGTQSIHLAHQHECAMTELSAKQPPSILAFISLVARHMAGNHSVHSTPVIFISLAEVLEWIHSRVHHVVHYLYKLLLFRPTASP